MQNAINNFNASISQATSGVLMICFLKKVEKRNKNYVVSERFEDKVDVGCFANMTLTSDKFFCDFDDEIFCCSDVSNAAIFFKTPLFVNIVNDLLLSARKVSKNFKTTFFSTPFLGIMK